MNPFLQTPPTLPDSWASDRALRESVRFHAGEDIFAIAEELLSPMGQLAVNPETLALSTRAESEPPKLTHYSAWGERIDDIRVSSAYLELGRIGVTAGVTAL